METRAEVSPADSNRTGRRDLASIRRCHQPKPWRRAGSDYDKHLLKSLIALEEGLR